MVLDKRDKYYAWKNRGPCIYHKRYGWVTERSKYQLPILDFLFARLIRRIARLEQAEEERKMEEEQQRKARAREALRQALLEAEAYKAERDAREAKWAEINATIEKEMSGLASRMDYTNQLFKEHKAALASRRNNTDRSSFDYASTISSSDFE